MDILSFSARELAEKIKNEEVTSKEIIETYFTRIEEVDEKLNAFITLNKKEALEKAMEIDEKISKGEKVGALAGIPISIKDNIVTKDMNTTCGSKMLENFIPPYDATVIEKIKEEDGIIIGKTNMDEFAMGSSTQNSYFGSTKNPYNLNKVAGGSSGGSAVSVATGEVAISLGTDTGGSVRQPAAFTGTVGFKPSYGLISRYGVIPFAPSLDQVGIISKNVEDAGFLLNIISGYDRRDSTSVSVDQVDYIENINKDIKGMKIGLPKEFFGEGLDGEIKEKIKNSIKVMEKLGATVEEVSLPYLNYVLETYSIISTAEASASMARMDGVRFGYRTEDYSTIDELYMDSRNEGLGEKVKENIMLGTYILSGKQRKEYFEKAQKVRTLIIKDFEKAFEKYDLLISPTTADLPFDLGKDVENSISNNLRNALTAAINLSGTCAISVPCGYVNGLPIGLQFIGDKFKEDLLLNVAYIYEKNSGIEKIVPSLRGEENGI
ncbi:MAG TPA: Asp-tRNA(Asn)/Glu-tRNA(Gln) amidotransferase subunit GatA [Tissierellales bacterium]|nr:Asp-tRNA(Asn)/Glu-tRNA(Gln) amidotransferase subunit GatA [Tissierellales bacterium]